MDQIINIDTTASITVGHHIRNLDMPAKEEISLSPSSPQPSGAVTVVAEQNLFLNKTEVCGQVTH